MAPVNIFFQNFPGKGFIFLWSLGGEDIKKAAPEGSFFIKRGVNYCPCFILFSLIISSLIEVSPG